MNNWITRALETEKTKTQEIADYAGISAHTARKELKELESYQVVQSQNRNWTLTELGNTLNSNNKLNEYVEYSESPNSYNWQMMTVRTYALLNGHKTVRVHQLASWLKLSVNEVRNAMRKAESQGLVGLTRCADLDNVTLAHYSAVELAEKLYN